jgi:hypothetical protein
VSRKSEEAPLVAPRPLITGSAQDIDHWTRAWAVDPAELAIAVRLCGPSITAVARAMGRPDGL